MRPREILVPVLLGLLGIFAAGAIALAADRITGEQIGLSAEPFAVTDGGGRLVERGERHKGRDHPEDDGTVESGDDHGGGGDDGGDSGSDDFGTGSSGSGKGSGEAEIDDVDGSGSNSGSGSGSGSSGSGSGSSGSGSGGSGSDDSPEPPDDD